MLQQKHTLQDRHHSSPPAICLHLDCGNNAKEVNLSRLLQEPPLFIGVSFRRRRLALSVLKEDVYKKEWSGTLPTK
jgi:hypothetical protein